MHSSAEAPWQLVPPDWRPPCPPVPCWDSTTTFPAAADCLITRLRLNDRSNPALEQSAVQHQHGIIHTSTRQIHDQVFSYSDSSPNSLEKLMKVWNKLRGNAIIRKDIISQHSQYSLASTLLITGTSQIASLELLKMKQKRIAFFTSQRCEQQIGSEEPKQDPTRGHREPKHMSVSSLVASPAPLA